MWQLIDIAYVIPVTVAIGYFLANFLEDKYGGDFRVPVVLIALTLGTVLTIVRIKKALDQINHKSK